MTLAPSDRGATTMRTGGQVAAPAQPLFVTVVIPAYNSVATLPRCLSSVFTQTYPLDRYEIVVVDDGSIDGTADVASSLARSWAGCLRVVRKANGGPGSARGAGIAATGGTVDVIAFIDADCVAEPHWIECLVERLAQTGAAGVGGPLANMSAPAWVSRYLCAARFYRHRMRSGTVEYLVTANVAFRRDALLAVGGFSRRDGVWGEDADLSFRMTEAGQTLLLAQQGIVTHYGSPTSLRSFAAALYRYGYGSGVMSRDWPRWRRPGTQIIRHLGAVALSPLLALAYSRRAGVLRAMSFWPLIVIEHASFSAGLAHAALWRSRRADT